MNDGPTSFYRVYDGGVSVLGAQVNPPTVSYSHTGLPAGNHSYQIQAFGSTGLFSQPKSPTPALSVSIPTCPALTATPDYCGRTIKLTLTPSTGATSYELSRSPFSPSDSGWGKLLPPHSPPFPLPTTYVDYVNPAFPASQSFTYQLKATGPNGTFYSDIPPINLNSASQSSSVCGVELYVMP